MPLYSYRGRDARGEQVKGQLDAASESVAADLLLARA